MTTLTIHIPDSQAATLKARAMEQGLTLEAWISRKLADEETPRSEADLSPQEAAAQIFEVQKRVKPDPEGWSAKDYINYGRP
jgi:hypothetical protein